LPQKPEITPSEVKDFLLSLAKHLKHGQDAHAVADKAEALAAKIPDEKPEPISKPGHIVADPNDPPPGDPGGP
jgi:hypothetical protein